MLLTSQALWGWTGATGIGKGRALTAQGFTSIQLLILHPSWWYLTWIIALYFISITLYPRRDVGQGPIVLGAAQIHSKRQSLDQTDKGGEEAFLQMGN